MGLNAELERLLSGTQSLGDNGWAAVMRKRHIEELETIFKKLKLPVKCNHFTSRYKGNGFEGTLYRSSVLITKIKFNGEFNLDLLCNFGFPDEFVEKISVNIMDVLQIELVEDREE